MLRLQRLPLVTMTTNSHITIGIDEVGRGPWAGPLLVSAVALDMDKEYQGLADSKKLTKKRREKLAPYVKRVALGIGLGWVDVRELDRLGMTASLKLGAGRAFRQLPVDVRNNADQIIVDGNIRMLDDPRASTLIKADDKVQAVSAASIVAKVARDDYMAELGRIFSGYGFGQHAGYGTKAHMEALATKGIIDGVHRVSFAPIKKLMGDNANRHQSVEDTIGRQAEEVAADYLVGNGFKVIDRNWKTKLCEIDIVAIRGADLCFVEVKYRKNANAGTGMDAITKAKLTQMKKAAVIYTQHHPQTANLNPRLLAISLSGLPPVVDNMVAVNY